MAYGTDLPLEMREIILDIVAKEYKFDVSNPYLRAGYAGVSQEWQLQFERENFRKLVIEQDAISKLEEYATEQRQVYLEHIFLRVRLNDYDCAVCQTREDSKTIRR